MSQKKVLPFYLYVLQVDLQKSVAENGITPEEATELIVGFGKWTKTCCFEVVEINPVLDNKLNTMAETAFEIIEKFTDTIESRLEHES